MSTKELRGVIFDMDGVLVDTERLTAEAGCRMFAEKGFTVHPEDFRPFAGMGEDRFLGGVAETFGIPFDVEVDKARTYAIYLDMIKGNLESLPGVREFIAECRRRKLRIAVASSADTIKVEGNLREIGLPTSTFDAVVDGLMVARKKAIPGHLPRSGEAIDAGSARLPGRRGTPSRASTAAKKARMRCLGLTTSFSAEQLREVGADWAAPDLSQAPADVLDW